MAGVRYVDLWIKVVSMVAFLSTATVSKNQEKTDADKQASISSTVGLLDCQKSNFTAVRALIAPYVLPAQGGGDDDSRDSSEMVEGPLHDILESVKTTCCGSHVPIVAVKTVAMERSVEETIDTEDIAYPVVKTGNLGMAIGKVQGYVYLPVIETVGVVILTNANTTVKNAVIQSLYECWPLALLVVSSAGLAGIIMWFLDHSGNPKDFPQPFMKGGWEGIWWAYVTMTTVGYGDKAPKSVIARIFGLVWMFVGIILMSIFTATLTTALTADEAYEFDLKGAKLGVVKGSKEEIVALKQGATIRGYDQMISLLNDVINGEIEGAAVDINLAFYKAQQLQGRGLVMTKTIANPAILGIILQGQSTEVENCFTKYISKSQFQVYDSMGRHFPGLTRDDTPTATKSTQRALASMRIVFIVLFCVWFVITVACMSWELMYRQRKQRVQSAERKVSVCNSGVKKRPSSASTLTGHL